MAVTVLKGFIVVLFDDESDDPSVATAWGVYDEYDHANLAAEKLCKREGLTRGTDVAVVAVVDKAKLA